jgi:hypothetical protein
MDILTAFPSVVKVMLVYELKFNQMDGELIWSLESLLT